MKETRSKNHTFVDPVDIYEEGDIIERGNFVQFLPDTEILKDIKDLTIRGGNWTNVKPQPTWKIWGGNWHNREFCTNEMEHLQKLDVPQCEENCVHAQGEEDVEIDEPEWRSINEQNKEQIIKDAQPPAEPEYKKDDDGNLIKDKEGNLIEIVKPVEKKWKPVELKVITKPTDADGVPVIEFKKRKNIFRTKVLKRKTVVFEVKPKPPVVIHDPIYDIEPVEPKVIKRRL